MLFNPSGDMIKIEEVKKPVIGEKQIAIDKDVADCIANPTDDNIEKFRKVITR